MSKDIDVYEVVKKLIGEIDPVGETRADERRLENLQKLTSLVYALLSDIREVAIYNESRAEFSMSKAGKEARKFLNRLAVESYA